MVLQVARWIADCFKWRTSRKQQRAALNWLRELLGPEEVTQLLEEWGAPSRTDGPCDPDCVN